MGTNVYINITYHILNKLLESLLAPITSSQSDNSSYVLNGYRAIMQRLPGSHHEKPTQLMSGIVKD